jgi:hypothetical protein
VNSNAFLICLALVLVLICPVRESDRWYDLTIDPHSLVGAVVRHLETGGRK